MKSPNVMTDTVINSNNILLNRKEPNVKTKINKNDNQKKFDNWMLFVHCNLQTDQTLSNYVILIIGPCSTLLLYNTLISYY